MKNTEFKEIIRRSIATRKLYHQLEAELPKGKWNVEEDALGFLTDAAVVGRQIMSQEGRWPAKNSKDFLEIKLGECIWWLVNLADRMDLDIEIATDKFLTETEKRFENNK